MNKSKICISRRSAAHLITVMTVGGIFMRLVVDGRNDYLNSAWICLIGGFCISVPAVLFIDSYRFKTECALWRAACIPAAAYMIFQTAAVLRLLVNSVSYSNYITFSPVILSVVMVLACLYIITKRAGGIGNAIKVCSIPFVLLLAIVIIGNIKYMKPRWLTPFIGIGSDRIIEGCLSVAGYILSAVLLYISSEDGGNYKYGCLKAVAIGAGIALILCVYVSIMTPIQPQTDMNRLKSIELLLSNGRTSLGVQLPITMLWFIGYIMALASYAYAAAIFIQQLFRDATPVVVGILSAVLVFVIANTGLAESCQVKYVSKAAFAVAAAIILTAFAYRRGKNV